MNGGDDGNRQASEDERAKFAGGRQVGSENDDRRQRDDRWSDPHGPGQKRADARDGERREGAR